MTRVALRGIRSHLGRFLLSVLAVLLGVAFVAGTFSLRTMMSSTFSELVETSTVGDAYVRGAEQIADAASADMGAVRTGVPLDLVEEVAAVDGVRTALPEITGPIVLVGADGTAVAAGNGPPSFALAMHAEEPSTELVDGRAPTGLGEVALESATLEASGLAVGDATQVVLGGEITPVDVVGEVSFGAPVAGATIVFLDPVAATEVFAPDGMVSSIAVYAEGDLDEEAVVERLQAALGSTLDGLDAEVATGEEVRDETRAQVEQILGFVSTFLLVFAAIALFVGAFIIANTFQMTVRQRQREFAMLRAIGASPAQVFTSILVQALVVGVLGSALGVGAGVALVAGLREVFARMGMELSGQIPLDGFTVLVSVLIGTVVSVVAAAVPARRAALTPPVEAMRDDVVVHDRGSVVRAAIGGLLLAGGVASVVVATLADLDEPGMLLGAGA
uniref:FtsX-like permease family protein n=1 Tax=Actinotalea sp. C106 TaxID=2908644 RepID=UPI00202872AF